MNKNIYIRKKVGRCDSTDYEFFASAELLWEAYNSVDGYKELTRSEFIESIENEELIEEFGSEFYRDVVVT